MPDSLGKVNPATLRRLLLANGYEPLPASGKGPRWQGWNSRPITPALLDFLERELPDFTNTGIRCGRVIATDNDSDGELGAALDEVREKILGPSLLQRVGSKRPGLHVYKLDGEPIPKIIIREAVADPESSTGKRFRTLYEVLGQGNQFIAYGLHPAGMPYEWPNAGICDGAEPSSMPVEALPTVTPAKLKELADALVERLHALGHATAQHSLRAREERAVSNAEGEPVTLDILRDMMAKIDPGMPRTEWIKVGGALHTANVTTAAGKPDPAFDAEELFCEWSRGDLHGFQPPANYCEEGDDRVRYDFNSLTADRPDGATMGSLVKLAYDGGYTGHAHIPLMVKHDAAAREPETEEDTTSVSSRNGSAASTSSFTRDDDAGERPGLSDMPDDGTKRQRAEREKAIADFGMRIAADFVDADPPEYQFEGLIPRVGVGILVGEKGVYKTFVAIDIGLCAVAKIAFAPLGDDPGFAFVERPNDLNPCVVHVAGEGRLDIETIRIPAWAQARGLDAHELAYIIPRKFPKPGRDNEIFLAAIRAAIPEGHRCAFVIFDTTARLMRGMNENSAEDAGAVIDLADYLSEHLGCFVLLIHHTKKDGSKFRGSSLLEDDPGVSLKLTKQPDGTVALSNPFQREGGEAPMIFLKSRPVMVETRKGPRETRIMERTETPKGGRLPEAHVDPTTLPGLAGDVARVLAAATCAPTTDELVALVLPAIMEQEQRTAGGAVNRDAVAKKLKARLEREAGAPKMRKGKEVASTLRTFAHRAFEGGTVYWRLPQGLMDRSPAPGAGEFDPGNL